VRAAADGPPKAVIVLRTLGAPQRRLLRRRRPRAVPAADPAPVPTARATVVRAEPFASAGAAAEWLAALRRGREGLDAEVDGAVRELNGLLRAQRAAATDPLVRDVRAGGAHAIRVGYGSGDLVAEGRYEEALQVPADARRRRRAERLAPEERLAAILSGREPLLAADELVLRARADLAAARPREAALQARIALECVLEETSPAAVGELHAELRRRHGEVVEAAAAAVVGDPPAQLMERVDEAVRSMEAALRRHRRDG
jgi:hypothetical protein